MKRRKKVSADPAHLYYSGASLRLSARLVARKHGIRLGEILRQGGSKMSGSKKTGTGPRHLLLAFIAGAIPLLLCWKVAAEPPQNYFPAFYPISQENIDLYWNDMLQGCRRAFLFNGDLADAAEADNGNGTDLSFQPTIRYWPDGAMLRGLCAEFNGSTSRMETALDLWSPSLSMFTIAFWVYARDGQGTVYQLGNDAKDSFIVSIGERNGNWAELEARFTASAGAVSRTYSDYRGLQLNAWRHVAVIFDSGDDATLRIFIDGREPSAYAVRQSGAAAWNLPSPAPMYVGNSASPDNPYRGLLDTVLFYERPLSTWEIQWLANELYRNAGPALRVYFWEKRGVLDPARVHNGVLCFQFDGGYARVATIARPVFHTFGAVANAAIISDFVDKGGRLSAAQLHELSLAGWEIISNSKTYADPYRLTEQQLRTELSESKHALESLGFTVNHYAWPYSAPHGAHRVICPAYYRSASDGGGVVAEENLYALGHLTIDTPGEAAVTVYKGYIDRAVTGNRMLNLLMHDPDPDDASTLSELLEYAQGNGIPILTRSSAVDLFVCKPPEPLDRGFSLRCENKSDQPQTLYRKAELPEGNYLISFLVWSETAAQEAAPYAAIHGENTLSQTHYQPRGDGSWLCWAHFHATEGTWKIGAEIQAGATVFLGDFTCYQYTEPPRVVISLAAQGEAALTWVRRPSQSFAVWLSGDLASPDWRESAIIPRGVPLASWTDSEATGPCRFYRLEILSQ